MKIKSFLIALFAVISFSAFSRDAANHAATMRPKHHKHAMKEGSKADKKADKMEKKADKN